MSEELPPNPYGSVRDLPSMQEMHAQLAALRVLGPLTGKIRRSEVAKLRKEFDRIASTVDRFYLLLGPRNWVFHDSLRLESIEAVVRLEDASDAEAEFVAYYEESEVIKFSVGRLNRHDAMRARMPLLHAAEDDFLAGRFYSVVLVLIAVLDGFVNDFEKSSRKGLHARSENEMVAWDSVIGHHLGLSYAHKSFTKSFKKTSTEPVYELHRHGIMHGMLTNFDNRVVATKAWNRLFAVADWADSRLKQAEPEVPQPTLRESLRSLADVRTTSKLIDAWEPRSILVDITSESFDPAVPVDSGSEVANACADFLARWQRGQYGPLGQHFIWFVKRERVGARHVDRLDALPAVVPERTSLGNVQVLLHEPEQAVLVACCANSTDLFRMLRRRS